jgi:methylthioribose-1-phosphate isomerase
MRVNGTPYRTVWMEDGAVCLIEQRALPHRFEILRCATAAETAVAIRDMAVRGAGAIGAAAGYAMAQGVLEAPEDRFAEAIDAAAAMIRATRPTANDLFVAVERVRQAAISAIGVRTARAAAVAEAQAVADENAAACEAIGRAGARLFRSGMRVLTHCNAGWLAFVDWGSALAPIYVAHGRGRRLFVYADETRPRSQGAKLTAWELAQAGVPHAVIADTAAGWLMQRGRIDAVIVGADRIAANGDTANKIGTYAVAVLARRHRLPMYVAAPRSTFDPTTPDGARIPIESRDPEEVLSVWGADAAGRATRVRVAAPGSPAENPAFDVTPAALISAFVTDVGVIAPNRSAIRRALAAPTRRARTPAGRAIDEAEEAP